MTKQGALFLQRGCLLLLLALLVVVSRRAVDAFPGTKTATATATATTTTTTTIENRATFLSLSRRRHVQKFHRHRHCHRHLQASPRSEDVDKNDDNNNWIDLTPGSDGGVQKQIILQVQEQQQQGLSSSLSLSSASEMSCCCYAYEPGTQVTMSYVGTLVATPNWNAQEVVTCWLSAQQGLDAYSLPEQFLKLDITEAKLLTPNFNFNFNHGDGNKEEEEEEANFFTETFVREELGVTAKIACKKLVMAAKRLKKSRQECCCVDDDDDDDYDDDDSTTLDFHPKPKPNCFDANDNYEFVLGSGKVIRGMELGVASMKPGERAHLKIRSDYAYGPEGYRKPNGNVLVPPFATLSFEISLQ